MPKWRKSTRSDAQDDCVEASADGAGVLVRDSKDPDGDVCRLGGAEFAAFVRDVKRGAFDL